MNNEVMTVGGGSTSLLLGEKLQLALATQQVVEENRQLPNLDTIKVSIASPEEVAERVATAQRRSVYARAAAEKIIEIRMRCDQLRLIDAQGALSSAELKELNSLNSRERKLLSAGDKDQQAAIRFSVVLAEIRAAQPTPANAREFLRRSVEVGRFRETTKAELDEMCARLEKRPSGVLFYGRSVYIPTSSGAAQVVLENELRFFLARVKKAEREEEQIALCAICETASVEKNLRLLRNGKIGQYLLYFSASERNGRVSRDGAALITLTQKPLKRCDSMPIIVVGRAAGSLSWLSEYEGKWISFASFQRRKSDQNLKGEMAEFSDRLIRTLGAAIAIQKNG